MCERCEPILVRNSVVHCAVCRSVFLLSSPPSKSHPPTPHLCDAVLRLHRNVLPIRPDGDGTCTDDFRAPEFMSCCDCRKL